MALELYWDDDAAEYVRSRPFRYPGGLSIEPVWAQEVLMDDEMVMWEPDPKSRIGASRFIGWSSSAQRILVVIAYRDLDGDLHLINSWLATGIDMTEYAKGREDDGSHNER